MTASHRFALLAIAASAALLLSACQPAAENIEANAQQDDIYATAEQAEYHYERDTHAGLAQDIMAAPQLEIEVMQDWTTRTSFDAKEA